MIRTLLCAKGKKMTTRDKKLSAIVFLVIGLVFSVIGYPTHKKIVDVKNRCVEKGYAVVLDTQKKSTSRGRSSRLIYRATLELPEEIGVSGNTIVTDWSDVRYLMYDKISIRYDPDDPKCIYVPSNPPYDSGQFKMRIGVGFIIVGAVQFVLYLLTKDR